jgi:release factor glutamine methyltransferase
VAGVRVAEAVAQAAGELLDAGVAAPRVDAELLAAHVLGVPRGRLAIVDDFPSEEERRFRNLVRARSSRVPLQHLTGVAPFRHLELAVGPGAFIPRPETELLVEWGLQWLRTHSAHVSDPPIVVDLCAGAGPIAASVATEDPMVTVYAVECEPAAVGWLRRNVSERGVTVVKGDATKPETLSELDGRVDLVLCNPPYVPEIGSAGLPPEVTEHDPHDAVFGGTDGLDVIRPLIGRLAALLRPDGAFAVEHDDTHAYVVPTLVDADGRFTDIELHHDLARRPRFTTATRTG